MPSSSADRQVLEAPGRHLGEHGQQLDALLGEAVDRLLLVARVVGPADDALPGEPLQPVGQDVGGDALLGLGEQLAEMPAVAEDHVADDEQAPFVAHHLQREIDRAARPVTIAHPFPQPRTSPQKLVAL